MEPPITPDDILTEIIHNTAFEWAKTNAKQMTQDEFKSSTGFGFEDFNNMYRQEAADAWRAFMRKRSSAFKEEDKRKRQKGYCSCQGELAKEPNAIQGLHTERPKAIRLWYCKLHGSTTSGVNHYRLSNNEIDSLINRLNLTSKASGDNHLTTN